MLEEDGAAGDNDSPSRRWSDIRLDPPTVRGIRNHRSCNGRQDKPRGGIAGSSETPSAPQQGLFVAVTCFEGNNPNCSRRSAKDYNALKASEHPRWSEIRAVDVLLWASCRAPPPWPAPTAQPLLSENSARLCGL
jgi:hypothetical protein